MKLNYLQGSYYSSPGKAKKIYYIFKFTLSQNLNMKIK